MKEFSEDANANEDFTEHQVGDRKTNSLHPAKEELAAVEPGQQPLDDEGDQEQGDEDDDEVDAEEGDGDGDDDEDEENDKDNAEAQ
jgi:hypothetical protein